jgi:hypothetical protein
MGAARALRFCPNPALARTGWEVRSLSQVAPVVEFVGVFGPAVADVGAVIHVGDEDVFDAGVDLGLGLLHGLARADHSKNDA